MNKIVKIMLSTAAVVMAFTASAQMGGKELSKELKSRVEKECRKDAKRLTKDGWRTSPGALSLEKQLQQSRYAALDKTSDGNDVFITATHVVTGGNYSIAKKMGQSRAADELSTSMKNEVEVMVENSMANQGVTPDEMESIDQFISKSTGTSSATLQSVKTIFEISREKGNQVEYQVTLALNKVEALGKVKVAMERSMKSSGSEELWSKVQSAF